MCASADTPTSDPRPANTDGNIQILFVDDDPGVLKIYTKRLELAGYHVTRAMDGEQALASIAAQRPDLIILDIMLPKLNGYEVCARLKQEPSTKTIPIVMFTAKGRPEEHVAGLMFGADAYVSKSCSAHVLIDQIKAVLERPPTVDA